MIKVIKDEEARERRERERGKVVTVSGLSNHFHNAFNPFRNVRGSGRGREGRRDNSFRSVYPLTQCFRLQEMWMCMQTQ